MVKKLFGVVIVLTICYFAVCSCAPAATTTAEKVDNATATINLSVPEGWAPDEATPAVGIFSGESGTWAVALGAGSANTVAIAPGTYTVTIVPIFGSDGTVFYMQAPTDITAESGQSIEINQDFEAVTDATDATEACCMAISALAEIPSASDPFSQYGGLSAFAEQIVRFSSGFPGIDVTQTNASLVALNARTEI